MKAVDRACIKKYFVVLLGASGVISRLEMSGVELIHAIRRFCDRPQCIAMQNCAKAHKESIRPRRKTIIKTVSRWQSKAMDSR